MSLRPGFTFRLTSRPSDYLGNRKLAICGFRRNWSTDSGGKWSAIPVGSGPEFRWEVVQFFEVTGMVDPLPECWTTWTGTVDQITGIGQ
jgi:hypothetical protein